MTQLTYVLSHQALCPGVWDGREVAVVPVLLAAAGSGALSGPSLVPGELQIPAHQQAGQGRLQVPSGWDGIFVVYQTSIDSLRVNRGYWIFS